MIQLPNGCRCSGKTFEKGDDVTYELAVIPKNWKSARASTKKSWYIHYRFYDPAFKEQYPKGKLERPKGGINTYHTLKERQDAVRELMAEVLDLLRNCQYNPISDTLAEPASAEDSEASEYIIHPKTPMVTALQQGKDRLKRAKSTLDDIQITLRGFSRAAQALQLDTRPIAEVGRRHVIKVLDKCAELNPLWSPKRFNKYKANLSMVWKELRKIEAVEVNIIKDIDPEKTGVKKKRQTLTAEERCIINTFLHQHYRRFWIFLQCFFHSGARETEMLRLKGSDVDLKSRTIKFTVLKGEQREEDRAVKEIAVPFWEMALEGCGPDDYIFSAGLKPGKAMISNAQISRRWRVHVKDKKESRSKGINKSTIPRIGIVVTADFYSLKHTNLTEVRRLLSMEDAARLAAHSNTKMMELHYAIDEDELQMQRLRGVSNAFA